MNIINENYKSLYNSMINVLEIMMCNYEYIIIHMKFLLLENYIIYVLCSLFVIILYNLSLSFFLTKNSISKIYKYYIYYLSLCLFIILSFFFYHVCLFIFLNLSIKPFQILFYIKCYGILLNFTLDNISLIFLLLVSFIIFLSLILHVYLPISNQLSLKFKVFDTILLFNRNFSFLKNITLYLNLLMALFYILIFFFTTLNILFFYIMLELSMLPIFFIIILYGSRSNKLKAGYYIFFYTIIGSLPFLVGIICLYILVGSLDLIIISSYIFDNTSQKIFWIFFFFPFATKVPLMPMHIWLPEAHVEAPTEGSVILAGLLLKLGFYGLIRFLIPLFPFGWLYFSVIFYSLAITSILYSSLLIFCQIDLKKIIAYSSIAHMNFALLGLFSPFCEGLIGSIYICFTHAIISSGLFICVGYLYSRFYTRLLIYYSGLNYYFPIFNSFFFLFILGNIALPGTGGFVGELLIFLAIIQDNIFISLISLFGSLFCTIYSILLYTKISSGTSCFFYVINSNILCKNHNSFELNVNSVFLHYKNHEELKKQFLLIEYLILIFLSLLVVITGTMPSLYLDIFKYNVY